MADASVPVAKAPSWSLLGLLLLVFAALCVSTSLLPHDPYVRVQQLAPTLHFRAIWGYERIVYDRTPIDVAVVGNSRLGAGVSAPMLAQGLSHELGRPIRVANLSLAQDGVNAHYSIAKLLLRYHPEVRLLLLSATEQIPRGGHPAFRNLADTSDIVDAPILFNRDFLDDLAYLPFRQMSLALQTWIPAFGNVQPAFEPGRYLGTDFDTTRTFRGQNGNVIERDTIHDASSIDRYARDFYRGLTPPVLPGWANRYEFTVPLTYTRKISELAHRHGTQIAFLYLPIFHYGGSVQNAAFYHQYGALLNAGVLAQDPHNYSDGGHLNHIVGVPRLNGWLVDQVARLLTAPPQPTRPSASVSRG